MHALTGDDNSAHFVDALWRANRVAPDVDGNKKDSTIISKPSNSILHTSSMKTHSKDKAITNTSYVTEQRHWIQTTLPKIEELKHEIKTAYPAIHISHEKMAVKTHFRTGDTQMTDIYYYAPESKYLFKRGHRVHRVFNTVAEVIDAMHSSNWQDMHLPDGDWHLIFGFCHELEHNYISFPHIFEY